MAWEDRDYYRGGGGSPGDYLGNPGRFLGLSAPLGTWFGVRIRASIWLILEGIFGFLALAHGVPLPDVLVTLAIALALLIVHEFGHRLCAQRVGGRLDEFLLWPAGGMIHPECPPTPIAKIIAHGGGIAVNVVTGIIAAVALHLLHYHLTLSWWWFNPLAAFFSGVPFSFDVAHQPAQMLVVVLMFSLQLVMINILPFYWFDGGNLLEGILQSMLGSSRATNVTCIAGMVVAVPLFLFALYSFNFLGIVVVLLLFADSFNRRREIHGGGGEEFSPYAASAFDTSDIAPRRRKQSRWAGKSAVKQAAKRAAAERRDQAKIDQILEKVHTKGMQSLTWFEKRALRKATERQRNR